MAEILFFVIIALIISIVVNIALFAGAASLRKERKNLKAKQEYYEKEIKKQKITMDEHMEELEAIRQKSKDMRERYNSDSGDSLIDDIDQLLDHIRSPRN